MPDSANLHEEIRKIYGAISELGCKTFTIFRFQKHIFFSGSRCLAQRLGNRRKGEGINRFPSCFYHFSIFEFLFHHLLFYHLLFYHLLFSTSINHTLSFSISTQKLSHFFIQDLQQKITILFSHFQPKNYFLAQSQKLFLARAKEIYSKKSRHLPITKAHKFVPKQ